MRRIAALMPHARAAICPNGSHMCMWDDQAAYFDALVPFLKSL
jgi:proline iminopeptidase